MTKNGTVLNNQTVHISKQEINLGKLPTFIKNVDGQYKLDTEKRRVISFGSDQIESEFPLIVCRSRVRECLEMNLFLMHRAQGKYAIKNNKHKDSVAHSTAYLASLHGEGVGMKYILSLAKDLRDFLEFLVKKNFCYEHVLAAPLAKDSANDDIASLPIWQYQQALIKRVEKSKNAKGHLAYSTANRRIGAIRHFYQWSYKRGCINHLPFSIKIQVLKRKSKKNSASTLFAMPKPNSSSSYAQWVANLSIPKTCKQKADAPTELQPYSPHELVQLLSTDTAKHRTYGLFFKCAYLGGLRDFEVPQIDAKDIFNPTKDRKNGLRKAYRINLIRKYSKPVNLLITHSLMSSLYAYTLDPEWTVRSVKHETKYGMDNPKHPKPLFMNRYGEQMADGCCGTAIRQVRREQRNKGLPVLERDFHDLRATFGTYLAMQMVLAGVSEARIKSTLLKLFSHEEFSTSEDYLDFAKALMNTDEHGEMSVWVNDMYTEVHNMLKDKEIKENDKS